MRLIINIKKSATFGRIEELSEYLQMLAESPNVESDELSTGYNDVIESVSMEK